MISDRFSSCYSSLKCLRCPCILTFSLIFSRKGIGFCSKGLILFEIGAFSSIVYSLIFFKEPTNVKLERGIFCTELNAKDWIFFKPSLEELVGGLIHSLVFSIIFSYWIRLFVRLNSFLLLTHQTDLLYLLLRGTMALLLWIQIFLGEACVSNRKRWESFS